MTATAAHGWVLEAVDRYEGPLLRYARRLLDDCDLAADAVQHAFLKLCEESHDRLEGRVAPKQIAEVTGRTEGHVRVITHRGLAALRAHPRVQALLADHRHHGASTRSTPTDGGTP